MSFRAPPTVLTRHLRRRRFPRTSRSSVTRKRLRGGEEQQAHHSQRKMSTISSTSVLSFLTWSRLATVTIGTYWSLSIWEMRYMSLARFSLRGREEGGYFRCSTPLRSPPPVRRSFQNLTELLCVLLAEHHKHHKQAVRQLSFRPRPLTHRVGAGHINVYYVAEPPVPGTPGGAVWSQVASVLPHVSQTHILTVQ